MELFVDRFPDSESGDWTLEIAREIWESGHISSSDAFFELAKFTELEGEDVQSAKYDSLREMISELAMQNETPKQQ